ncbi:MAG: hypothetical protein J6386_12985 [Candidatus Synoicihabitans palmerolidicus]|nr:hypothetical protein [Candidatus Synoicihabitans palmerolidicus]
MTAATINGLASMSQAGMVTLVDIATGTVVRVPWRAGLNVYGSGALAKVKVAKRALAIVREDDWFTPRCKRWLMPERCR